MMYNRMEEIRHHKISNQTFLTPYEKGVRPVENKVSEI